MLDSGETSGWKAAPIFGRNANSEKLNKHKLVKLMSLVRGVETTVHHRLQETTTEDWAWPLKNPQNTQEELVH